jgi:hypothetical protein
MGRMSRVTALTAFAVSLCVPAFSPAFAQDDSEQSVEEVVVNQAAGRVVVAVVKNAILIGTAEDPIEPGTRPPVPVALSSVRAGVLLGAVDWISPSLQKSLARLDKDLPGLRESVLGTDDPHLSVTVASGEATDIEAIGKPLREKLNTLVGGIHSNLNWPASEPIVQLVLADYAQDYGPEVWQLSYTISQEQQKGDYWITNVDQPVYLQIWPPEKGQPHTLMEFDYPQGNALTSLLDMLRQRDPRLQALVQGDAKMADTANKFLSGDSAKIAPSDATQFLRAALGAVTPANSPQTMAIIRQEQGFDWILAPPAEPKPPRSTQPSGAPSLANPQNNDDRPSLARPPGSD